MMSVRKMLEKDVFIRLDESGFVETVRYFGLPDKCLAYETAAAPLLEDHTGDEREMLVRMPTRRDRNRLR